MSLDRKFLEYPQRRHGMDHDRYAWSMLAAQAGAPGPASKPLALWINLSLEHFPAQPPRRGLQAARLDDHAVPGPAPLHAARLRQPGRRVPRARRAGPGRYGLRASAAVNGELALRYPALLRRLRARTRRAACPFGWNMDSVHHGGMEPETLRPS
jgi:hypothetical protein